MKKIYVLALAAVGALLLIEGSSWGKLDVAACGRNSRHSATRCHVAHHHNPYGMALRGNIYGQADGAIYSYGYSHGPIPFYSETDPDPRIAFELHRDPSWARTQ
jgi:hypothetical protein